MKRVALIPALLALATARALPAQSAANDTWVRFLRLGTWVRFADSSGTGQLTGRVIALRGDSARVQLNGRAEPMVMTVDGMRNLEVRSRVNHPMLGMAIGSAAGAVAGYLTSIRGHQSCDNNSAECSLVGVAVTAREVTGILKGVAIGGLAGLAVGALIHTDVWTPVGPARIEIKPVPGRGVALGIGLKF